MLLQLTLLPSWVHVAFTETLCRYGIAPAQFKAFMDATGQLWQTGGLVGKPVTFVTSTASQGGGQEVTILTCEWPTSVTDTT